jgi:hypothetical protein
LTYDATGTPPACALFDDGATDAAPTGEQRRARARGLAEVEAERLLGVEAAGDRRGELADQAARIAEVVVLHAQEAGDRAAGDEAVGKGARRAALADADLHLGRIEGIGERGQRRRLAAEDELLAAAEEDADGAVGGADRRHLGDLREVGDRRVALVEQVVRLVAGALDAGDAAIEVGDPRRQRIDRGDRRAQVLRDAGLDRIDLVRGAAKARREVADAGQHDLPRRRVLRLVRDVDEGVEHLLRGVAEPGLAGREHRLELLQLAAARRVGGGERRGRRRLAGEEVAVRARHRRDVDALAEEARARSAG